ncbi:MAG: rRNA maturation RNase YbeY, partial [Rhodoferax sp.]|nr:rRNA maturation RNase YbeY [Rhodoferax sp.]
AASDASRAGSAEDEPPQPPGDGAIVLDITDTTDSLTPAQLGWLEAFGVRAIDAAVGEAVPGADGPHRVELSLVDDAVMSELHLAHGGVEGTTDVLTFDLREGGEGPLEVEVVVCLDEARRMAGDEPVEREALLYLLHGALHCLGYDDHDPMEFARMHEREDEILRLIGVGAVFDDRRPCAEEGS